MNISFKKVNARTFLNVKQYQEALNEKINYTQKLVT